MTARPDDRVVRTWRPGEDVAELRLQFHEPVRGCQGEPLGCVCPRCEGVGDVSEFDEWGVTCDLCNGRGRVYPDAGWDSPACG